MKKLIHYRLGVSRHFPTTHPRSGEPTNFPEKILNAKRGEDIPDWIKLHTIRANYDLWAKCFEKINKGEAVLDLFYWSGKPYRSKQVVFATLTKEDGIGLQMLEFSWKRFGSLPIINGWMGDSEDCSFDELAKNDGLSLEDFKVWFKSYDLSKPLAIIHFTKFRY